MPSPPKHSQQSTCSGSQPQVLNSTATATSPSCLKKATLKAPRAPSPLPLVAGLAGLLCCAVFQDADAATVARQRAGAVVPHGIQVSNDSPTIAVLQTEAVMVEPGDRLESPRNAKRNARVLSHEVTPGDDLMALTIRDALSPAAPLSPGDDLHLRRETTTGNQAPVASNCGPSGTRSRSMDAETLASRQPFIAGRQGTATATVRPVAPGDILPKPRSVSVPTSSDTIQPGDSLPLLRRQATSVAGSIEPGDSLR